MRETPLLSGRGLRRRYGRGSTSFEAVRGVDIEVHRGELFALLGTNGAGKTSTMEMLEGIAVPTGGTVRIDGLDPVRHRRRLRPHMGVVLQQAGFSADLTVRETALMWSKTMAFARPVDEVLERLDVHALRDVQVYSLSGGERRRLDIALATMGRPSLLFLDEPTTGLDPESRSRVWDVLKELLAEGAAIVLTTHYLHEAEELADRVSILRDGEVVVSGTVAEVLASRPSVISFRVNTHELPRLSGSIFRQGHDRVQVSTDKLQLDLYNLLRWANEEGIALNEMRTSPASLEEVFLAVAGREAMESRSIARISRYNAEQAKDE